MDPIVISVAELAKMVKDLTDDKMDFVELTILEEDSHGDDATIPSCLCFEAWTKKDSFEQIDFGSIDVIKDI